MTPLVQFMETYQMGIYVVLVAGVIIAKSLYEKFIKGGR